MDRLRNWFLTDRNFMRDIITLYMLMMIAITTACGQARTDRPHARNRITSGHETTVSVRHESDTNTNGCIVSHTGNTVAYIEITNGACHVPDVTLAK